MKAAAGAAVAQRRVKIHARPWRVLSSSILCLLFGTVKRESSFANVSIIWLHSFCLVLLKVHNGQMSERITPGHHSRKEARGEEASNAAHWKSATCISRLVTFSGSFLVAVAFLGALYDLGVSILSYFYPLGGATLHEWIGPGASEFVFYSMLGAGLFLVLLGEALWPRGLPPSKSRTRV